MKYIEFIKMIQNFASDVQTQALNVSFKIQYDFGKTEILFNPQVYIHIIYALFYIITDISKLITSSKPMEEECSICNNPYDLEKMQPMMVCPQQHTCCEDCLKQIHKHSRYPQCHMCKHPLTNGKFYKFRYFQAWTRTKKNEKLLSQESIRLKKQFSQIKQKNKMLKDELSIEKQSNQLLILGIQSEQKMIACLKEKVKLLIINQHFQAAIIILQKIIKAVRETNFELIGLGSKQELLYQQYSFRWFESRYNLEKSSLYDYLAIVRLINSYYKGAEQYYKVLIEKDSNNFKALFGLALVHHNNGRDQTALEIYQQITKINPQFDRPYQMMALIHLSRKKEHLALDSARQCLMRNPDNICAKYIWVINISVSETAIRKGLSQIVARQPTFIRAIHSIGVSYLNEHKEKQAIQTFQKCLELNESYVNMLLSTLVDLIDNNQYHQVTEIFKLIDVQQLTDHQLYYYYYCEAGMHLYTNQVVDSLNFYKKCLQIKPNDKTVHYKLANVYMELKEYGNAVQYLQLCFDKMGDKLENIQRAIFCCEHGQFQGIRWFYRWIELQPDNQNAYIGLISAIKELRWSLLKEVLHNTITERCDLDIYFSKMITALIISSEYTVALKIIDHYISVFKLQLTKQSQMLLKKKRCEYAIAAFQRQ